jgi:predicted O-linked N-acetylglucosamine transferase (SPINDLY family)
MTNTIDSINAIMEKAKSGQMSLEELFQSASELQSQGQTDNAQNLYKIWLACTTSNNKFAAYFNWGVLLAEMGAIEPALLAYEQCLQINPDLKQARINLGLMLERKGLYQEALAMWQQVVDARSNIDDQELTVFALNHMARMQETRKIYDQSEAALEASLRIKQQQPDALQHWVHIRQKQCKWPVLSTDLPIRHNQILSATSPLAMLALKDDPALQWLTAQSFVNRKYAFQHSPLSHEASYLHKKIRIGYLSGDLCTHAVGLLMADLIEAHDKNKFEIFAFDFSPEDGSAYRQRLRQAFDHFIDIKARTDIEAAVLIRQCEIDVLIDLHGLSSGARPSILAHRPAPIQMTYLGFIGTTAMPWIDYVITDRFALPETLTPFFSETPIYIDGSFIPLHHQPSKRVGMKRADFGFTEKQTVLACFNNIYKITPEVFASWMSILEQTNDSVLWLLDDNPWATKHLMLQAQGKGMLHRVNFSNRCSHTEYIERLSLADLYLDTYPYNAGSTARDVLDAQLPMLTLCGKTFISRMAGSMLSAASLSELITYSQEDYQYCAIQLIRNKDKLHQIRQKIAAESHQWDAAPQKLISSLELQINSLVAKQSQT